MKIAIPKERRAGEARVAATPETVKKMIALGAEVAVEAGAGLGAAITDETFRAAGASIVADPGALLSSADVILKVQRPMSAAEGADELAQAKPQEKIDGISMVPTLLGQPQTNRHDFLYWEFHERGFQQAVRMGDWKAIRPRAGAPLP